MTTRYRNWVFVFILAAITGPWASAQTAHEELHATFKQYYEWRLREFPEIAMSMGDYSNADKVTDQSLEAIRKRHEAQLLMRGRARAINPESLSEEDRLNQALFDRELSVLIDAFQFQMYLAPVGGRYGPQQDIAQMHERVRFATAEDYENYLNRLEQVPKMVDDVVTRLKLGVAKGITPPRVTLADIDEQFRLLEADGLDDLGKPFESMPDTIPADRASELRGRFPSRGLRAVRGAIRYLGKYLTEEYVPHCRTSIAATSLPNGEAYYAFQLRHMTTTDLTAEQIHEIGLQEVARLRAEMLDVIRSTDFMHLKPEASTLEDDALFDAFIHYLRTDLRFYHDSAEALLMGYRDICKRIDAGMPKLFESLPRLPYGVRAVPDFMAPMQTTAYYWPGDIRNAEPGYFYANTYALDQRPKYEMVALAMHEAVPGHHHQIAIAQEMEDVPEFRKEMWITAFGEGWALYSERLGLDIGMYENPYDNFGRLLYEMWRACRLVVDPGMHALGWDRQRAVDFMLKNTALSELNVNTEVDRYIAWPGQATAYKIGELKITEMRHKAEAELGEAFDLRTFHDVILTAGPLPLDILETRVDAWIERSRTNVQTEQNQTVSTPTLHPSR